MSLTQRGIELGNAVGTGLPVFVPLGHTAVTGQTQASGKTTTMEAMIARAEGLRAVAFVTKRGEGGFSGGVRLQPYFRERADWQFVAAVLEATMRERLKFERAWIMRASKGAKSLKDVQHNVEKALLSAKGMSADVYFTLNEYLQIVVPQIDKLPYTKELNLSPGLNVMDLSDYSMELQALVIRSVLEWIYEKEQRTVCILPEAWEFIPQNRGSPVKLAAEQLIRKGGALQNYVWLDSQDIAAVHKDILRSIRVWILGVQREANEIKRLLEHIPASNPHPKATQIATLERGQFYVCHDKTVVHTYVRPAWMEPLVAAQIARGEKSVSDIVAPARARAPKTQMERKEPNTSSEGTMNREEVREIVQDAAGAVGRELGRELAKQLSSMTPQISVAGPRVDARDFEFETPPENGESPRPAGPSDEETLFRRFKDRLIKEAPGLLKVILSSPELEVSFQRTVIDASGDSLRGRVARLIKEGWFKNITSGTATVKELNRTGAPVHNGNTYREFDKLVELGFLTKEEGGFREAPGMKVNIKGS